MGREVHFLDMQELLLPSEEPMFERKSLLYKEKTSFAKYRGPLLAALLGVGKDHIRSCSGMVFPTSLPPPHPPPTSLPPPHAPI